MNIGGLSISSVFFSFLRSVFKVFIVEVFHIFIVYYGIVILISFSASLLIYRETTGACMLILYPTTLPEVLIRSRSSGVEYLWSLSIKSQHLLIEII
jgi:hypothetical protein